MMTDPSPLSTLKQTSKLKGPHMILGLSLALAWFGLPTSSWAQFTLNFQVDQAQAEAALGPKRVGPMNEALDRVKNFFEAALVDSAAALPVPLRWEAPGSPTALADAGVPSVAERVVSWVTVRDRLENIAEGTNEPFSEIALYQSLPPQQVMYKWDPAVTNPRTTAFCLLTYAQSQQLQLNPAGPIGDETRVRVKPPNEGLKWQFWRGKLKPMHHPFDVVVTHEVMHLLGYISGTDASSDPNYVTIQDVYRFADADLPADSAKLLSGVRELRPTVEASLATRLNASHGNGAYQMSRGTRTGGDGRQGSHFRAASRLNPPDPIGIMDPSGEDSPDQRIAEVSRADVTVLDVLGWTIEPSSVDLHIAGTPGPVQTLPLANAMLRTNRPTFTWTDPSASSRWYTINVFKGDPYTDPDPLPVTFDHINSTSFTIPAENVLSPGLYTWELLGCVNELGFYEGGERQFTILCPADFNGVGGVSVQDIFDFLAAWFEGGESADFNGAGGVSVQDIFDFLQSWFSPC